MNTLDRILFIGLGGAGQRHLRVIRKHLPSAKILAYRYRNKTPLLNSDFSVNDNSTLEKEYNIDIYDDLDQAYKEKPKLVVIATPTSFHFEHIIRASDEGAAIIVEKPGCMNSSEAHHAKNILLKNKTKFLISFQRRFHPLIIKFKQILDNINKKEIDLVDIKVQSYVPSWHPYEDYKELYACKSSLGGGVLLTESHELDLVIWLFGEPNSVNSRLSTRKDSVVDVEDSAHISLKYESFEVNIMLDFMSIITKRQIHMKTKNEDIFLDMDTGNLKHTSDCGKRIIKESSFSGKNMFSDQFNFFMNLNCSDVNYINSLTANLDLIDKCKQLSNQT